MSIGVPYFTTDSNTSGLAVGRHIPHVYEEPLGISELSRANGRRTAYVHASLGWGDPGREK